MKKKLIFGWHLDRRMRIRSRIRDPVYGSKDQDQSQNITDSKH
jgi:hypothetical protein